MSASPSFPVIETNKLVSVYKDTEATQIAMELFTAMHLSTAPMVASSYQKISCFGDRFHVDDRLHFS